jgi:hypothetical protein
MPGAESYSDTLQEVADALEMAGVELQDGEVERAGYEVQNAARMLQAYLNREDSV